MNLLEYCENFRRLGFPKIDERQRPPRDHIRRMQANLEEALRDDAFLVDCFEHELKVLGTGKIRLGLPSFFSLPDLGIRLSFVYWAPDRDAGAHEHTDWTITAVCHNALEVFTYDRDRAYTEGRLIQKNVFAAPAGRAGHIYEPCIHNPHNPTDAWTLSLHVISPYDGQSATADGRPPFDASRRMPFAHLGDEHPYVQCAVAREREHSLRVLSDVLANVKDSRAFSLLEAIFRCGNVRTRRHACVAMARLDPERARPWRRICDGSTASSSIRLRLVAPAIERETRVTDGRAELVVHCPWGIEVLLRVDAWARGILDILAREQEILVRDLPGGLDDGERLAIVEALEDWSLFTSGHGSLIS